jgi:hypothetical protein
MTGKCGIGRVLRTRSSSDLVSVSGDHIGTVQGAILSVL